METSPETISSFLKGLNLSKVASIDNLPVKFLNDGTDILARPISQLCNLSICCLEVVKLQIKYFFKKCSQIDPDNYRHVIFTHHLIKNYGTDCSSANTRILEKSSYLQISVYNLGRNCWDKIENLFFIEKKASPSNQRCSQSFRLLTTKFGHVQHWYRG